MALFRKRTADDIVAPLTTMIDQLKEHRDASAQKAAELVEQVNQHNAEYAKATSHLDKLSAIFGG